MAYNFQKIKSDKIIVIICIIIIVILSIFLFFKFLDNSSIVEKESVYTKVIVSDHYGIEVNGSALVFGMLIPGGSAIKTIDITNDYGNNVKVTFLISGEMKKILRVSENDFILKKGEYRKIYFTANPPRNISYGTYEGNVEVIIKKV